MKSLVAAMLSAATLSAALPALAQPGDYRYQGGGYGYGVDINGLSVDEAKRHLSSAGYSKARNISVSGQQFDLWSNPRSRDACFGFSSYKGRVTETRSFDGADCGVVNGGWGQSGFPSGLRGMRVDDGKRNLRNYGYEPERNVRIDGQQWDLWSNSRGRDCIGFASYKGTISDVREFRGGECTDGDWSGGGWGGGSGWLDIRDLQGRSVDDAKRALSDSGFRKARNIRSGGQQWDLWYDARGRGDACIGFTSYNGRVTDVRTFSSRDC